jgi:hypothetical protein
MQQMTKIFADSYHIYYDIWHFFFFVRPLACPSSDHASGKIESDESDCDCDDDEAFLDFESIICL